MLVSRALYYAVDVHIAGHAYVGSRAEPVGRVSICAQAGVGGEDWRLQNCLAAICSDS